MAVTLPTHGQLLWDNPLNTVLHNLASAQMLPNDHGYMNWSSDPQHASGGINPGAGSVRMVKLPVLPLTYTITSAKVFVSVAGVALTAGQCFVGIYDATGARVALSADQAASWATVGLKTATMTVPYVVPAGAPVWVAILYNGTSVQFAVTGAVSGQGDLINADLTPAVARFTSGPNAQTSLPASITMAARVNTPQATWAAVA